VGGGVAPLSGPPARGGRSAPVAGDAPVRVCVDCHPAWSQRAGIGRAVRGLIEHLPAQRGDDDLVLFSFGDERAWAPAGAGGGRGRRKELEATFDHGETEGYGLWLDAAVKDNPVYAEHWAGKRDVTVRIEADQIVIRRAGSDEDSDSESDE